MPIIPLGRTRRAASRRTAQRIVDMAQQRMRDDDRRQRRPRRASSPRRSHARNSTPSRNPSSAANRAAVAPLPSDSDRCRGTRSENRGGGHRVVATLVPQPMSSTVVAASDRHGVHNVYQHLFERRTSAACASSSPVTMTCSSASSRSCPSPHKGHLMSCYFLRARHPLRIKARIHVPVL